MHNTCWRAKSRVSVGHAVCTIWGRPNSCGMYQKLPQNKQPCGIRRISVMVPDVPTGQTISSHLKMYFVIATFFSAGLYKLVPRIENEISCKFTLCTRLCKLWTWSLPILSILQLEQRWQVIAAILVKLQLTHCPHRDQLVDSLSCLWGMWQWFERSLGDCNCFPAAAVGTVVTDDVSMHGTHSSGMCDPIHISRDYVGWSKRKNDLSLWERLRKTKLERFNWLRHNFYDVWCVYTFFAGRDIVSQLVHKRQKRKLLTNFHACCMHLCETEGVSNLCIQACVT